MEQVASDAAADSLTAASPGFNEGESALTALERLDPRRHGGRYVLDHYGRYALAAQFVAGKRVLDVACGFGYGSHLLKQAGAAEVVGVDLAPEAIAYAKQHYASEGVSYHVGDAHQLDRVVSGPFDVIVSFETVEHLSDPARFIQVCRALGAANAVYVFSVPNEADSRPDNPFHVNFFDRAQFEKLLVDVFPTFTIIPYYMTLAAAIGEAKKHPLGPLGMLDQLAVQYETNPIRPDGFVAVCGSASEGALKTPSLIIHSRKCYMDIESDREWLEHQRISWMESAQNREEQVKQQQEAINWLEGQRVAWMKTAEDTQAALRGQKGVPVPAAPIPPANELAPSAWRRLADEREQSLEAQEDVNRRLQEANQLVEKQVEAVRDQLCATRDQLAIIENRDAINQRAIAELRRDLAVAMELPNAMRATIAWKLAERLRRIFPVQSRRGRALRKSLLWMRRVFGPANR